MSRERILTAVRQALAVPHPPHPERPAPPPSAVEGVAPRDDLVALLRERFEAVGGHWHAVADLAGAGRVVAGLGPAAGAVWVAPDQDGDWGADALASAVSAGGRRVVRGREEVGDADEIGLGVTGALLAIADSGTLALAAGPDAGRLPGVLPPIHCVVARPEQVVADLEAAMPRIGDRLATGLTSGVILVTGPSKTGDIEGRLVVGVHGPKEIHLVLLPSTRLTGR